MIYETVAARCPRGRTCRSDSVGKIADDHRTITTAEAGDFAHPTAPYDSPRTGPNTSTNARLSAMSTSAMLAT
jgi:hypothetical protein